MYKWILIFLMLPVIAMGQSITPGGVGTTNADSIKGYPITPNSSTPTNGQVLKIDTGPALDTMYWADDVTGSGVWTERSDTLFAVDSDGDTVAVFWDDDAGNVRWQVATEDQTLRMLLDSLFSALIVGGTATTSDLTLQTTTGVGATGADMHFLVGNNGGTEAMTILNNGNVGIGINSPSSIFHIKADVPGTVGSHPAGQLIIQNPINSVFGCAVITGYESDAAGNPDQQLWYLGSSSSSNSNIIFLNRRNSKLELGTNGTTRLTIDGDGNVGIGTVTPGAKLMVDGSANERQMIIQGNATQTADFFLIENSAETDIVWVDQYGSFCIRPPTDARAITVDGYEVETKNLLRLKSYHEQNDGNPGIFNIEHELSSGLAGDLAGVHIDMITTESGSGYNLHGVDVIMNNDAKSVGLRLDDITTEIEFVDVAATVAIANTGTISFTDGINTLMSLIDMGTTGNLEVGGFSIGGKTVTGDKHWNFNLFSPNLIYDDDTQICIDPRTSAALTVTRIDVTLDADPTTELEYSIKFADAFIGLASATVIEDTATVAGITTVYTITGDATVPANKCIYIQFEADPDANITQVSVNVTWDYD